jgi:AraC family transcriptional regulator of adaptative response / DNA-3-methyladenine glycosylase II
MRLIADGLVDREGVHGLAARLDYSERQVHRLLVAEVGSGPLALARAQRAQTARILIETTALPITDVAFASGFHSVRQFNDTVREVYASTPTQLRDARSASKSSSASGPLTVRLACREPFDGDSLFTFLAVRAVPGVESVERGRYARSLRLAKGHGVVSVEATGELVTCSLVLDDVSDVQAAVQRTRRLLDLDSDPTHVDEHLAADPLLAPLVAKRPGLRAPGHPDGTELLVRAVLGQQVSVAGARTLAARLVAAHGEPLSNPVGNVTHVFPSAATIAGLQPEDFAMPRARGAALIEACAQVADGRIVLDAGSDRDDAVAALQAVPGIGPWTAGYVAMRALGHPDVFLPTDIGVRNALVALGADGSPKSAAALSERWRPWRSYALHHLWASL